METRTILQLGALLLSSSALLLGGCASSSGVRSYGAETHRVEGSSEFGLASAKDAALKDAAEFCSSSNQAVHELSSRSDSHVDAFGDRVETWELIFQCVSPGRAVARTGVDRRQVEREPDPRDIRSDNEIQALTREYNRCTGAEVNDQAVVSACTRALRLDPRNTLLTPEARIDVFFNRSLAYARMSDLNRAISDMESVLRVNPGDGEARNLLADMNADLAARNAPPPRVPSRRGPERWEIVLSAIANNTVHVNDRQIFKQKSGSNRINIGQFFKSGANTIVIRRKHVGKTNGQRAIFKRAGNTVLTLLPKDLQPMAMEFGSSKNLAQIQIQPETGACWILRGWGVISGRVQMNSRAVDISGWEPCEEYRYLPPTPIVGHAMPLGPNPTKVQYLKAFYDYFKPLK